VTNLEFVEERLAAMERTPGMWAFSTESFGLQLMMLVEFASLEHLRPVHPLMVKIFGGGTLPNTRLDDEWAKFRVVLIREYLATGGIWNGEQASK